MTVRERREITREAQKAMKDNGMEVFQKDMILLELSYEMETINLPGCEPLRVKMYDYIMFEDKATGRQWQCFYGVGHYNPETGSLWEVLEYVA